jgi:hypothetical protein
LVLLKNKKIKINCLKHDDWPIIKFSKKASGITWKDKNHFCSGKFLLYIFTGGVIKVLKRNKHVTTKWLSRQDSKK